MREDAYKLAGQYSIAERIIMHVAHTNYQRYRAHSPGRFAGCLGGGSQSARKEDELR